MVFCFVFFLPLLLSFEVLREYFIPWVSPASDIEIPNLPMSNLPARCCALIKIRFSKIAINF